VEKIRGTVIYSGVKITKTLGLILQDLAKVNVRVRLSVCPKTLNAFPLNMILGLYTKVIERLPF